MWPASEGVGSLVDSVFNLWIWWYLQIDKVRIELNCRTPSWCHKITWSGETHTHTHIWCQKYCDCVIMWEQRRKTGGRRTKLSFARMCAKSLQWCPTLCNAMDCSPPGSSAHRDSPDKNTGVGCPPPGDLPNPGIEPMFLISPALASRFFTTTTWEIQVFSYTMIIENYMKFKVSMSINEVLLKHNYIHLLTYVLSMAGFYSIRTKQFQQWPRWPVKPEIFIIFPFINHEPLTREP